MTDAATQPPRLTLLYQLFRTNLAARHLLRAALEGSGLSGEEFAVYSYFVANGPKPMTQTAREFGMPFSTLASWVAPMVDRGHLVRMPNPRDRRSRLLDLTVEGRAAWAAARPRFADAYTALLVELDREGTDPEVLFAALAKLRDAMERVVPEGG